MASIVHSRPHQLCQSALNLCKNFKIHISVIKITLRTPSYRENDIVMHSACLSGAVMTLFFFIHDYFPSMWCQLCL